jgi:hypothetical protein
MAPDTNLPADIFDVTNLKCAEPAFTDVHVAFDA